MQQLLALNQVQQQLNVLCLTPQQVRLQSYFDTKPACVIRYRPISEAAECLRTLSHTLNRCHIYVALMESAFDGEICGRSRTNSAAVELHILQSTMSSARMVVGEIITGNQDGELKQHVVRAVEEACQVAQAICDQRQLLERNQQLRIEQEAQLRLSEAADAEKERMGEEEVRKHRLEALDRQGLIPKFPRPNEDMDSDSDVEVTFKRT